MLRPEAKSNPAPTRASTAVMPGTYFPVWLTALLLVLVTIALYWPATQYDFVSVDDPNFVTENPHIQDGLNWEGVKWAFCNTGQASTWAPLLWLSHLLAWQLFGPDAWGHHLINVLLHAANTALVFLIFRQMTGAAWRSLILAALFGLHPLRVESVVWVTERKDVLSTLFWMLTLWAYVKHVEDGRAPNSNSNMWYGAALAMFVLGLMSKAMLVTLPCVLLLLDYWPLERFKSGRAWQLVVEKFPFFALAALACVVTFMVQKHGGAVASVENLSLGARSGNALISYCRYLEKMFWPTNLAIFYPHPGYWPPWQVLLAGGFLCGISVLIIMKRGRHPCLLVGWMWYVGTLVPVIGLVQVGAQSIADRYTYIPAVGVLILVIWGACGLTRHWRYQGIVLSVTGSAVIVLGIGMTRQQLGYWKDNETLFRHALNVTEKNYHAHKGLGDALLRKGQIDEAIDQFEEAALLMPGYIDVHYNLGNTLLKKGLINKAINQFQEAIRLKPGYADAYNNLGTCLLKKGQVDEAISQFQVAIRLKPDLADAHYNLGNAFLKKIQTGEAVRQFQAVIRLKPGDVEAHNNLGAALAMNGQIEEAINQFQEAIRLKPDDPEGRDNLARALRMRTAPAGR